MKNNIHTVVIPAAGIGSRLGNFTKNYSKAMCTLGNAPVISHIINNFSNDDEIIVLLGYKGDILRQVINICHPEKNIKFVDVDNFDGEGSGLGYSLSCAKHLLQKPFIFWSCDTVLPDLNVNQLSFNDDWMIGCKQSDDYIFNNYRHIEINNKNNVVTSILPKDALQSTKIYNYVGVAYIKHYKEFWSAQESNTESFVNTGEVYGLLNIKDKYSIYSYITDSWIDCGNRYIFEKYKKIYNDNMTEVVLEKPDESIWFINDRVIKFHIDEKFIADRVKRYDLLCDKQIANNICMPKLLSYDKNVYAYKRADGIIASSIITPAMLHDLLTRYLDVESEDVSDDEKLKIYLDFYRDKTIQRINKYCNDNEDIDGKCIINGLECEPALDILKHVKWENLSRYGVFTKNYHGDFHLENILVNNDKYIILDWRQNFGKTMIGDVYYDIAKMWHSLIVNHMMVRKDLFDVTNISNNEIRIDIHRTLIDTYCEDTLKTYIANSQYDIMQAEFLTAIIFLNIAACHTYPYSRFLFNLGKYMINNLYIKYRKSYIFN